MERAGKYDIFANEAEYEYAKIIYETIEGRSEDKGYSLFPDAFKTITPQLMKYAVYIGDTHCFTTEMLCFYIQLNDFKAVKYIITGPNSNSMYHADFEFDKWVTLSLSACSQEIKTFVLEHFDIDNDTFEKEDAKYKDQYKDKVVYFLDSNDPHLFYKIVETHGGVSTYSFNSNVNLVFSEYCPIEALSGAAPLNIMNKIQRVTDKNIEIIESKDWREF